MKISELLQKPYWYRRLNNDCDSVILPTSTRGYVETPHYDGVKRRAMTSDDFLNELYPSAHNINSRYYSTRPIKELVETEIDVEVNGEIVKKKIKEWRVVDFASMETVRLGLQYRFALSKASYFAANGFNITNETEDDERYNTLLSWRDVAGLDVGFLEVVKSCFMTGDGALYLYQHGNTIEYRVFSTLNGDRLYHSLDENRNPVVAREYTLNGRHAVDIFRTGSVETWVQSVGDNKNDDAARTWWAKVKNWFKSADFATSEDGYIRTSLTNSQTYLNQCVYFRIDDVVWGIAQDDIEGLERSMSYIAEETKNMAFPDMFVKATKIESLPPMGAHGRTWAVRGNVDDIKAADVKAITKPDMSNIAIVDSKNRFDSIMRSTLSVFVDPELVKSADLSGAAIKILYGPEIQFAQMMWTKFYHPLKDLVEVLKALVAKIENDGEYTNLRTSIWQELYLPEDKSSNLKMELDQVYARVKSRKAVMADLNNGHRGDYDQIIKEWLTEMEIKSKFKNAGVEEEPQPDATTPPDTPKIDNNSLGKSIAD